MKNLIFILFFTFCTGQTNQYKEILLSKKIDTKVTSYKDGYGLIYNQKSKNESIVDSLGNITYTSPDNSSILHLFNNRFIIYLNEKNYKRREGIIDEKGIALVHPEYQSLGNWWNNKKGLIITKDKRDKLLDYNGKIIIPLSDKIESAGEDLFFVKNGNAWFLYNSEGKRINERQYKQNGYFENGKMLIVNDQDQSEIIDIQGKTLHIFSKYKVESIETYPYLVVKKNGKYGLINTQDNLIAKEEYDEIFGEFPMNNSPVVYLRKNNKIDIFWIKNQAMYAIQEKYLDFLFKNYFAVYNDLTAKNGIIKMNDEEVLPQVYGVLEHYVVTGKDFIYTEKDKVEELLDENFHPILDIPFSLVAVYPHCFIIRSSEKYYSFNPSNNDLKELTNITSVKSQNLNFFNSLDNYSKPMVCKNESNLYGILDKNLNEIVPFIYDDIITFSNSENEIVVKKSNKFGVINYENEPLKDLVYSGYQWNKEFLKLTKDKKVESIYFTRINNN